MLELRKITLNLFSADCDEMKKRYGYGWSEKVRELVHDHLRRKQTVGEVLDG